ncbi:MAG TPA: endonuclease/exonuclease/phosphatase family protein [Trueperaceae bacterium]|nr:endonuclease/exonuclease/phosphatase family protein [Trueperaceae bacterium]
MAATDDAAIPRHMHREQGTERRRRPFLEELLTFLVVSLAYLVLLPSTIWFAAYRQLGDHPWWMFVVNSVAPYLFLPVPIVLIGALLARRWGLAVAALVPAAIFVMLFGQLFVPVSARAPVVEAGTPTLTLMTYNLHALNFGIDGIADAIASSGADVVALQELEASVAAGLAARLGDLYPYRDLIPNSGWSGLGVFSKVPMRPEQQRMGGTNRRNPQVLTLQLPWGDTTLINVHNLSIPRTLPDWPSEITASLAQRERVARAIHDYSRQRSTPMIAVGDFNTTERSTAYETVALTLTDSWREVGYGFGNTFPGGPLSPTPLGVSVPPWLLRIDYVFHSDEIETTRAVIGPWDGGSDHRPVLVTLAWPGAR